MCFRPVKVGGAPRKEGWLLGRVKQRGWEVRTKYGGRCRDEQGHLWVTGDLEKGIRDRERVGVVGTPCLRCTSRRGLGRLSGLGQWN